MPHTCFRENAPKWGDPAESGQAMLNDEDSARTLADEEKAMLAKAFQKERDLAARDKLITHHLRFIQRIARRFSERYPFCGMDYEDMRTEGVFGFMRAIEDWDPERGALTTHAGYWVKNFIGRAIQRKGHIIGIPVHAQEDIAKSDRISERMKSRSGYEPTDEELAELTETSVLRMKLRRRAQHALRIDGYATTGKSRGGGRVMEASRPHLSAESISMAHEALPRMKDDIDFFFEAFREAPLTEKQRRDFELHSGMDPNHPEGLGFTEIAALTGVRKQSPYDSVRSAARILSKYCAAWRDYGWLKKQRERIAAIEEALAAASDGSE